MKICEAFDLRNVEFASNNCLLSYGLKGKPKLLLVSEKVLKCFDQVWLQFFIGNSVNVKNFDLEISPKFLVLICCFPSGLWAAEDNASGEYLCSGRSTCNDLVCLGSCRGTLHLYNFPVLFDQAKFASQKVHVGEVFSVSFLFDDSYIISSGSGRNGCVVQWSVNRAWIYEKLK